VSASDKKSESTDATPEKSLDKTMPPMKLQQKSLDSSQREPLDKTTPEMREFLGSEDRRPRRK